MNLDSRPLLLAAALAAALLGTAATASAQLVPRLIDYPVAPPAIACQAQPQTTLSERRTYAVAGRDLREIVTVYADRTCTPQSLLFTLQYTGTLAAGHVAFATMRVIPTAGGVAALRDECGRYDWAAGVARELSVSACGATVGRP